MRTEPDELCYSCRNLPWGDGRTIEEALNLFYNNCTNEQYAQSGGDRGINSVIYHVLHEKGGCYACKDLVLKRAR